MASRGPRPVEIVLTAGEHEQLESWARRRRTAAGLATRSRIVLGADIRDWLAHWNEDPRPFIWTKTTDQILETIAGSCSRVIDSGYY